MFCPNCGTESPDGSAFCQECGAKLDAPMPEKTTSEPENIEAPAPVQPEYQTPVQPQHQETYQPQYQPAPAYTPYQAPSTGNTVLATIRKCFSSPLFLTATILMTIGAIASLITNILYAGSNYVTINTGREVYRISAGGMSSSYIIGIIIGMAPSILIVVGLWITYATARKQGDAPFTTAGLTMIKVIAIISMVFLGIGFIAIIIAMFIGGSMYESILDGLSNSGYGDILGSYGYNYGFDYRSVATSAIIIALVLIAVVFALVFLYLIKLVTSINTVKRSATTFVPSDKVSGFVAVMMYIIGVIGAIAAIAIMATGSTGSILLGLTALVSSIASILFGAFIFKYKNAMKSEMLKYAQSYNSYGQYPQYNNGYYQQAVTGVTCPRCGGVFASNLPACPHCGLPRQSY